MPEYRFDEIAICSKEKKKPTEEDKYTYIGLEHLDAGSLTVTRWGSDTKLQLKHLKIQSRNVTLRMSSSVKEQIVAQRRSTTFSSVGKTSFRNPIRRSSRQICSIGFISGVYGGI